MIIKDLGRTTRTTSGFPQDASSRHFGHQRCLWFESLLRDFEISRARVTDMIDRQKMMEENTISVTALRDS
jgi:hypothetical protein